MASPFLRFVIYLSRGSEGLDQGSRRHRSGQCGRNQRRSVKKVYSVWTELEIRARLLARWELAHGRRYVGLGRELCNDLLLLAFRLVGGAGEDLVAVRIREVREARSRASCSRRERLSALEAELIGKDFERDLSPEPGVASAPDLTHPSGAERT